MSDWAAFYNVIVVFMVVNALLDGFNTYLREKSLNRKSDGSGPWVD